MPWNEDIDHLIAEKPEKEKKSKGDGVWDLIGSPSTASDMIGHGRGEVSHALEPSAIIGSVKRGKRAKPKKAKRNRNRAYIPRGRQYPRAGEEAETLY